MKSIKELDYNIIKNIINEYDVESLYEQVNSIPHSSDLYSELSKYIDIENFNEKSVLGIDIYRYSSYGHFEQTLIPFIFKRLFHKAIEMCNEFNHFIFQKYSTSRITKSFLSTGDGGFLILDTPLHSLIFAINFEFAVRAYNSFHLYPKLRKIIGHISLRYAITYDKIFAFDDNFYGRAIINNARILQKDNLNRTLIDQPTSDWFMLNTDGIENLQIITIDEISNIYDFQYYDKKISENTKKNLIFGKNRSRESGIINSDVLRIGQITSKETQLNIFNIHLQVIMRISDYLEDEKNKIMTISLGNLNTSGI